MNLFHPRRLVIVAVILSLLLIASFVVSTWSFYSTHQQNCQARNTTLGVIASVVALATKPAAGEQLTVAQKQARHKFTVSVATLIKQSRCY
jgi:uncharacterized membrane protein HdeD (DUF308 family)